VSEGACAAGSADPGPVTLLYLCMEVAGCPTVCRHCWAQGTGYGMMPLADIEWVLDQAHQFCLIVPNRFRDARVQIVHPWGNRLSIGHGHLAR